MTDTKQCIVSHRIPKPYFNVYFCKVIYWKIYILKIHVYQCLNYYILVLQKTKFRFVTIKCEMSYCGKYTLEPV